MGLFSLTKKREHSGYSLAPMYSPTPIQYGKQKNKSYPMTTQLSIKQLNTNKHKNIKNSRNMYQAAGTMTWLHQATFIRVHTALDTSIQIYNATLATEDILKSISDAKEVLYTSQNNETIINEYGLYKQLQPYSYSAEKYTFTYDGYVYKVLHDYSTIEIVEDLTPSVNRKAIGTREKLEDIGVIGDIYKYEAEKLVTKLRSKLLSDFGVDYNNSSMLVIEESVDFFDKGKNTDGTHTVEISGAYRWKGHYIKNAFELFMQSFFDENSTVQAQQQWESFTRNMTKKVLKVIGKVEWVSVTVDVPQIVTEIAEELRDENVLVKYKDVNNNICFVVRSKTSFITSHNSRKLEVMATLPIKGKGVPTNSTSREYKLWKLALVKGGYAHIEKKRVRKNAPRDTKGNLLPQSIYEAFSNDENVRNAVATQRLNLLPFYKKSNRKRKEWIKFAKILIPFLSKTFGPFPKHLPNSKAFKTIIFPVPEGYSALGGRDNGRLEEMPIKIQGIQRYVSRKTMNDECFINVEPNIAGYFLYINIKDYSKSTYEEKNRGIYYGYWQYGLNLGLWFNNLQKLKKRVIQFNPHGREDTQYLKTMLFLDLDAFRNTQGYSWFNDNTFRTLEKELKREKIGETKHHSREDGTYYLPIYWSNPWNASRYDDSTDTDFLKGMHIDREHIEGYKDWLKFFRMYLPPMPYRLWLKVPYIAKREAVSYSIFIEINSSWMQKEASFLGHVLGLVMALVGTVLALWTGGSSTFLTSIAQSLIVGGIGYQLSQSNIPLIHSIGVAMQLYAAVSGIGGGGSGGILGAIQTAASTVAITNILTTEYYNYTLQKKRKKLADDVKAMEEEGKEIDAKKHKAELDRVYLEDFDVSTDTEENIDRYYYIAYGGLLYNEAYDPMLYGNMYGIYENYDRFK